MLEEALSAYRCFDLLFLHWKLCGVIQTKFALYINNIKVEGPVVGIRLAPSNQEAQHYILITRTRNITDSTEIKICDEQENTLGKLSIQQITPISNEIVKQFPVVYLSKFWKGLFDYLPKALPDLDIISLYQVYSYIIETKTSIWVLPDNLIYIRIPVSSVPNNIVTELRLISKTKFCNIVFLHSFSNESYMKALFSIDEIMELDQSILIFIFENKFYVPFKISMVNVFPKGVNAWHDDTTYTEQGENRTYETPVAKTIKQRHMQLLENIRKPFRNHNFFSETSIPKFTIIIPLFHLDVYLLKTQCSALALDTSVRQAEILLVACLPELEDELISIIKQLILIYKLRLRLVLLGDNVDWHIAINAGLSVLNSKEETAFFLHPAVIPQKPGWISILRNALLSEKDVSIAVPLLLYEDGTIAHSGYVFESTGFCWTRTEPGHGLSHRHPCAPKTGIVDAISLVCAAVNLQNIESFGGFSERFTTADYASSELCFRVSRYGQKVILVTEAQLWLFDKPSKTDTSKVAYIAYDKSIHPVPCVS